MIHFVDSLRRVLIEALRVLFVYPLAKALGRESGRIETPRFDAADARSTATTAPARQFHTIAQLVLTMIRESRGEVSYETVTAKVREHFPESSWQKSHWMYYKYQIKKGRFRKLFEDEGMAYLKSSGRGPVARDQKVKQLGDEILTLVQEKLDAVASSDEVLRFKVNRWVFSRLQVYERKLKAPIKRALWASGIRACQRCELAFESLRGIELHRVNEELSYSLENCQLLCRTCHKSLGRSI